MSDLLKSYEHRIELLNRKALRERKAREMAEEQLERYSREIYQSNLSLNKSLAKAKKKHAELEFLSQASSQFASDKGVLELLNNTVELTGKFIGASYGTTILWEDEEIATDQSKLVWSSSAGWQHNDSYFSLLCDFLPDSDDSREPQWFVLSLHEEPSIEEHSWLLLINFQLEGNRRVWIAFLSNVDYLDEESLFVLDTAKGQLLTGIRRRNADAKIARRNEELRQTTTNLEDAQKQLLQSEKMASIGQLAAGVAHEINNPIGFINANLEALNDYMIEFKKCFQVLESSLHVGPMTLEKYQHLTEQLDIAFLLADSDDILKANLEGIERVIEIVTSLKSFSHIGDDTIEFIDLKLTVEKSLKLVANELKYQHHITNNLPDNLPNIPGNEGKFQQVLINLFVNAAHAMPEGGNLIISHKLRSDTLVLCIEDTGIGMDEQTKEKIFTPFFTTKPVGTGTGLGLSVSFAILEAHQVNVTVDSEVGKGTCFNLTFPRHH